MQYPYYINSAPVLQNTVRLESKVQEVVNGINSGQLIPYGDYGGDVVYVFQTMSNGLGSIKYTVFDRATHLGLSSFLVRFGAATVIKQIIFDQMPKNQIDLQFLILPKLPISFMPPPGNVIPG